MQTNPKELTNKMRETMRICLNNTFKWGIIVIFEPENEGI